MQGSSSAQLPPPTALVMSWLVMGDSHSPGCRSIGAISWVLQARSAAALAAVVGLHAVVAGQECARSEFSGACWPGRLAAKQRAAWATSSGRRARAVGWCRGTAPRIYHAPMGC